MRGGKPADGEAHANTPQGYGPPRPLVSLGSSAASQFLRRNMLLMVATGFYLAISILIFVQMDVVYYDKAKAELVKSLQDSDRFLNDPAMDNLRRLTNQYLKAKADQAAGPTDFRRRNLLTYEESLRREMEALFEGEQAVWQIRISDKEGQELIGAERLRRLATQNDFSNNLFFREWSRAIGSASRDSDAGVWLGTLEIHYTSPKGYPEVVQLTSEWRLRAALIAIGLLIFYCLILYGVLLPIRSLIRALDKGPLVHSPIIQSPRTLLERYFNNLARDANLSLLSTELRDYARQHPDADHSALLEIVAERCTRFFPIDNLQFWILRRAPDSDAWEVEGGYGPSGKLPGGDERVAMIRERAAELIRLAESPPEEGETGLEVEMEDGRGAPRFCCLMPVWADESRIDVLLGEPLPARGYARLWWSRLYASLAREAGFALEMLAEQRRLIMMEKRKANISLSRNLGHDLTNIIATSKLELMTLKSLISMEAGELKGNPRREGAFRESLGAVLDNTRFLQEIVNLYRSFTYMSHPRYEDTNVFETAQSVGDLFQLSVSSNLSVRVEGDGSLPPLAVEPRLFRLALFNLLSNAADSIKRATTAENPKGEIVIRVEGGPGGSQDISVSDTGNGIRTPDGRLLKPDETPEIFELGYSTKEKGSGEGLGLNWVQQIVRDFHGGEIEARNRSAGGAVFTIRLHGRGDKTASDPPAKMKVPK